MAGAGATVVEATYVMTLMVSTRTMNTVSTRDRRTVSTRTRVRVVTTGACFRRPAVSRIACLRGSASKLIGADWALDGGGSRTTAANAARMKVFMMLR